MNAHERAIDRQRDGDAHLLILRVDDEVRIDDVVEAVHAGERLSARSLPSFSVNMARYCTETGS